MVDTTWPTDKLALAKQNLVDFGDACAQFVADDPYTLIKHHNGRDGRFRLDPPPPFLGLLFGQFVHNLRCALDHAVYELIRCNPNLPKGALKDFIRRCSFPICTDPAHWTSNPECGGGALDVAGGVAPNALAAIKALQPFQMREGAEYHPLALLQSLDNRDKHRELNVAISAALLLQAETSPGQYKVQRVPFTKKEGADIPLTQSQMEMKPKLSLAIFLTEGGPAPSTLLWTPELKPIYMVMTRTAGPTFPDFLLWAVEEAMGRLTSLLPI